MSDRPPHTPPTSTYPSDGWDTPPYQTPGGQPPFADAPTQPGVYTPSYMNASGAPTLPPAPLAAPPKRRGLSRRSALIGAGAGALGIGAIGAGVGFALSKYGPQSAASVSTSDAMRLGHLLRRAGFGPSPSDIGDYLHLGVQGSIDRLLNPAAVADTLDSQLKSISFDFTKAEDMVRWFTLRMLYTTRPLEEKMTLFWSGVLTSSFTKIGGKNNYPLLIQQNTVLRQKALGKFDDLVRALTTDPAMLWWLDGRLSTGARPNENYSRELMELFTMGIGNYTQDDVHQGALALAGWTVRNGQAILVPHNTYTGSVTYLGHTGHFGVDDIVRIVCAHPATAHHIAWRMWSFFVYENPSDADLKPLMDAYTTHDHSISAMLRAMFTTPAFFSAKAYRARIKSPVEFVVSSVRALGLSVDARGIATLLQGMGQVPFDPPDVSGWDGDKVSASWVSTQSWMARVNFINLLVGAASGLRVNANVGGNLKGTKTATPQKTANPSSKPGATASSPLQSLIDQQRIASAKGLVDYAVASLLDNNLSADRRAALLDTLDQQPASASSADVFTLHGGATIPAVNVRAMLYLLMSMPEFQMN